MESAIVPHLKCPRSQARRIEESYAPAYPAWVARAGAQVQQVVMGYFGVQWLDPALRDRAQRLLGEIEARFGRADGPRHFDRAYCLDNAGYGTLIATAYWNDPLSYQSWAGSGEVAGWWDSDAVLSSGIGCFREVIFPPLQRFETLFSTPTHLEGVGIVMGSRSESDVQEHAYWGSMRDRIPLSQTDPMEPSGKLSAAPIVGRQNRVRVFGHQNIAVIRSGQDWSATQGRERALYLTEMEPTLRAGMTFLRDHGPEIGCYSNRYLQHVDAAGNTLEKSFGLSTWRSLGDLETWAEKHATHLAIFGTFMRIVQELQFQLDLGLYHEVSVLASDQQEYEYINCHAGTGMLRQPFGL